MITHSGIYVYIMNIYIIPDNCTPKMLYVAWCRLPSAKKGWFQVTNLVGAWVDVLPRELYSVLLPEQGTKKVGKCENAGLLHYHKVKFVETFPKTQRFKAWIPILRWRSIAYPPAQEFRPSKQLGIYGLEAIDGFVHEVPHKLSVPMDELRLETMKFHGKVFSHVLGQTPINLW